MSVTVVVDVPVIEAKGASSALTTCNAALGAEQCALAGGEAARWYAEVRFDSERGTVFRITLRDGGPNGPEVASSQLEFEGRDSPTERWASAGVVVAALVVAQRDFPAKSAPPAPVAAPKPARLAARPPMDRRRVLPRLELGATGGSESSRGTPRFGLLGRFGIVLSDLPVFALGSVAYTVRSSGAPDIAWLTGSLGFGVRVGFAAQRAALEVRTEAVLESLSFEATDGTRSASARRTRWGPRFGLDLSGRLSDHWSEVVGAEAAALRPSVVIDLRGSTVDHLPPFSWGFISALRYDFR